MKNLISLLAVTTLLTACGSGGSQNSTPIAIPPVPPVTNTAPVVANTNANQSATSGTAFTYDATQGGTAFSDPGDTLTYTVTYSPSAMGLTDSGGVISGTPTGTGTVTVTVTATDSSGATISDTFDIVIAAAPPANTAPTLTSANANQTATAGTAFSYDTTQAGAAFTDTDAGDTLTYTVAYSPSALGLTDAGGVISGTPTAAGTINVTVTATDTSGATATDTFTITVAAAPPANTAPTLASANANQAGTTGTAFTYDATQGGTTFADADAGDTLTYTVAYAPSALGLTDAGGVISGTPTASGTVTVTITATDTSGATVTDTFDIVITAPAANTAPTLTSANADNTAQTGTAFNYDATQGGTTFTDADAGDTLTYTVAYAPSAMGLTDAAGVISGTPAMSGTVTVTITATDTSGATAVDTFDIVIAPAGIDQNALWAITNGTIDLNTLENYAAQPVPAYITKDNTTAGNVITDAGATLGRVLFYDPALSIDDTVSCSSCHQQDHAFGDPNQFSNGVAGGVTGRHSTRLINTQFAAETQFFWDKRAMTHEIQETMPLQDFNEHGYSGIDPMGVNPPRPDMNDLLTKLQALEYYQELFTFVFGDPMVTEARMQLALAQFVKSIQSFDSKYDTARAMATSDADNFMPFGFTASEENGKALWFNGPAGTPAGAGCNLCHSAPEFDIVPGGGHIGIITPPNGSPPGTAPDFTVTRSPSMRDVFKPGGATNGPFMHDGSMTTMLQVIDHYNVIIRPPAGSPEQPDWDTFVDPGLLDLMGNPQNLSLTAAQKTDLENFMRALTGTSIYTDPKLADPF